jgi:hypothetical protein
MALSSRCGLLRAVVYNCLYRFEQHLLSQRFYCKEQILTMLTLLKQSIKKPNLKLAPIVALFLSKLVDLFTHPGRYSIFSIEFIRLNELFRIENLSNNYKISSQTTLYRSCSYSTFW